MRSYSPTINPIMKRILLLTLSSTLLLGAALALNSGCASSPTKQSTGEYIDDATISTKIKGSYATDDLVKATSIQVETFKGTVQLSGFADTAAEKARAEQIARSTAGVKAVVNNIVVK